MANTLKMRHSLLAFFLCVLFCSSIQAAELVGLGYLSGSPSTSQARAVSADGSVVVGISYIPYQYGTGRVEAFRWTANSGMEGLGTFYDNNSEANGISGDGSTAVGYSFNGYTFEAVRWTENAGIQGLGNLTDYLGHYSIAYDASFDGSIVVGYSQNWSGASEAFRWNENEGMVGLGDLAGGVVNSMANGVSDDGNIIVGSSNSASGPEAFRWAVDSNMVGLGFLPGGSAWSYALDVSADGNVIVGHSDTPNGSEAFRWTSEEGMVGLGDLEGGSFYSYAHAVSADGRVVVGASSSASETPEAIRWTQTYGMQSIMDLLIEDGIDLTGWQLLFATDVSADGTVIVGSGYSPNVDSGMLEAWLVRIDSGLITPEIISQSVNTLLPVTESSHALARESLDTHLMAARHYRGRPNSKVDVYASGFGGEWNSYTVGGTVGLAWNVTEAVRMGAGIFASSYNEDDLKYDGEYELDALGGTLWVGYEAPEGGLQFHVVGLLADLENDIDRGYLNGSGTDKSKGDPDGDMTGLLIRSGWKTPIGESTSVTPFVSYSWSEVEIDGYTETGGGFPARFDSRKDNAEVVKVGLEGETELSQSIGLWGQAAYGNRLDDDSDGISGEIVGLMGFALPGYKLDDDWFEADLGVKWQAMENLSVMLTGGSAFDNDQNPDWRTSLGVTWSLM